MQNESVTDITSTIFMVAKQQTHQYIYIPLLSLSEHCFKQILKDIFNSELSTQL